MAGVVVADVARLELLVGQHLRWAAASPLTLVSLTTSTGGFIWRVSLLHDQDEGKTEQLAYTPDKTTVDVVNDTDVNGLAAAVSQVLTNKGFEAGNVGNNDAGHVTGSQVQAAKADDLGAQAVSKELGGLPVVENASVAPGSAASRARG